MKVLVLVNQKNPETAQIGAALTAKKFIADFSLDFFSFVQKNYQKKVTNGAEIVDLLVPSMFTLKNYLKNVLIHVIHKLIHVKEYESEKEMEGPLFFVKTMVVGSIFEKSVRKYQEKFFMTSGLLSEKPILFFYIGRNFSSCCFILSNVCVLVLFGRFYNCMVDSGQAV